MGMVRFDVNKIKTDIEQHKMAGKKKQGIAGLKDTAGGMKREDRQSLMKNYFEPISVDAQNALTVMYMLRSPEGNVVLRAVASLERFGRKAPENLKLLDELGIFEYIIPLVQHEDFLVKRFAQKLIALLSGLEEFRQEILSDDMTIIIFVTILEKEDDVVMHEFASLTLAELSSECFAAARILQIDGSVDVLYQRLLSLDPDVQKNCLDVMKNLLREIDGIQYFLQSTSFNLKSILNLTNSEYQDVQISAFKVIEQFMSFSIDDNILSAFRDSSGTEIMIGIVENEDWTDLHELALDILLSAADNPAICEYLQQSGCLQRIINLLKLYKGNSYLGKILGILSRISNSENGRKALVANNVGQIFGDYLMNDSSEIQEPACLGLANMALYPPALDDIMSSNPSPNFLDIVTNIGKDRKLRETASYALKILSHQDYRVAQALLEGRLFERLLPLLSKGKGLSVEAILNILQIFIGIIANEKFRCLVISENVISAIMNLIQDDAGFKSAKLEVAAMECLSSFLVEDAGRSLFHDLSGAKKLVGCLKNKYASVRQWAALLVIQMSQKLPFVKSFIREEGLKWLIDNKEMRYSAPSWESAIEAIFRAYLPAKFALTGRLDLHDLTQDGFFILSRPSKLFFILDDILEVRACPVCPVLVSKFELETLASGSNSSAADPNNLTAPEGKGEGRRSSEGRGFNGNGSQRGGSFLSDGSYDNRKSSLAVDHFGIYPPDPYLPEYLAKLRYKILKELELNFRDPQWLCIHPKLIQQRAQILARFVADEMSGPVPDPICKDHCLEMHINDIRYELETNVIPIGCLRIGSYLERAFLFKVLADRIGLPCAFVRGQYGRAWVEIAVPTVNINETKESKETQTSFPKTPPPSLRSTIAIEDDIDEDGKNRGQIPCYPKENKRENFRFPSTNLTFMNAFPTRLLKANAIVDLVHEPGRILPFHSYEAEEYQGCFLYSEKGFC